MDFKGLQLYFLTTLQEHCSAVQLFITKYWGAVEVDLVEKTDSAYYAVSLGAMLTTNKNKIPQVMKFENCWQQDFTTGFEKG